MAKLKIMRKTVKTKYAADGRDHCVVCGNSIQVGEEYTTRGQQSSIKRRRLYCRACAEEKNILS